MAPLAINYTSLSPPGTVFSLAGIEQLLIPVPSRNLHNGATLLSANLSMQVGRKHLLSPQYLPIALLLRDDWAPWAPEPWASGSYAGGALVVPSFSYTGTVGGAWGLVYSATGTGGTTSGSEPNWLTALTIGSTVTDGSVTWVATGYINFLPWTPSSGYGVGGNAHTPTASNGLCYVVTSISGSGTSAATEPLWPQTIGATVIDNPGANQVVWTCFGSPRAATWQASTTYKQSAYVSVSNGFYYLNTAAGGGTSGSGPAWGTTIGGTTPDGSCTWLCIGTNPIGAGSLSRPSSVDAYYDGGVTQTMLVPCGGTATVVVDTVHHSYALMIKDEAGVGAFQSSNATPWSSLTGYAAVGVGLSSYVTPAPPNGFYYACVKSGTSATTPPTWSTVLGQNTALDGSAKWQCQGSALPSLNRFQNVAFSFGSIADMRPE